MSLRFIYLTKSQQRTVRGSLWWVNRETGSFACHHTLFTFLRRVGAVEPDSHRFNQAGLSLIADFGNELKEKWSE